MSEQDQMAAIEQAYDAAARRMTAMFTLPSDAHAALGFALHYARLVGAWRRLLVDRERRIYRPLMTSPDPSTALLAATCRDRMRSLAGRIEAQARHWSSSAIIAGEFDNFRLDVLAAIAAIHAHRDCDRALLAVLPPDRRVAA